MRETPGKAARHPPEHRGARRWDGKVPQRGGTRKIYILRDPEQNDSFRLPSGPHLRVEKRVDMKCERRECKQIKA